jgi:hypothetical protein
MGFFLLQHVAAACASLFWPITWEAIMDNRVYGGDPKYVHIPDGMRKAFGRAIAVQIDKRMRLVAKGKPDGKPLCPGCYMVALVNAAITLADANGQSRKELGQSMAQAFLDLAANPKQGLTEEIAVKLDPPE